MIELTQQQKAELARDGNSWGGDGCGNEVAVLLFDPDTFLVKWKGQDVLVLGSPSEIRDAGGDWDFLITELRAKS